MSAQRGTDKRISFMGANHNFELTILDFVCGLYLIWCWTRAKPCNDSANPRRDKEQHSGEDERAKHDEQKLVHTLMILQRGR